MITAAACENRCQRGTPWVWSDVGSKIQIVQWECLLWIDAVMSKGTHLWLEIQPRHSWSWGVLKLPWLDLRYLKSSIQWCRWTKGGQFGDRNANNRGQLEGFLHNCNVHVLGQLGLIQYRITNISCNLKIKILKTAAISSTPLILTHSFNLHSHPSYQEEPPYIQFGPAGDLGAGGRVVGPDMPWATGKNSHVIHVQLSSCIYLV